MSFFERVFSTNYVTRTLPRRWMATGCFLFLFLALFFVIAAPASGQAYSGAGTPKPNFPIAGNPPLTVDMVGKATEFFEWLLDAKLTAEQRRQFQDSLINTWKAGRTDEIQGTVNVIQFGDQLNQKTPQEREAYRQVLQSKFLEQVRAQPNSALSRWVLDVYDSAHKPLAAGNPPLTQQVVDAYAEFMEFMVFECTGKRQFEAARTFKDALAQALIARYKQMTPAQQAGLAQVPALWAVMQARWPATPEDEKQKLRDQWRSTVEAMAKNLSQPASAAAAGNGQNQSSPGSLDEMMKKEQQKAWVNQLSQQYMTNTTNIILRMGH